MTGSENTLVQVVLDGPLLLALGVAVFAGLVSFLSPCVLPLVPGYLSYVSGLAAADVAEDVAGASGTGGSVATKTAARPRIAGKSRVVLGAALFVAGFSAVFVSYGVLFGGLGSALAQHADLITRVLGGVTIIMGLAFMGAIPGLQREFRVHRLPGGGLLGAPALGVLFGLGWTPCLGPTLAAVQVLAYDSASAGRGALLTAAYCIGLGVPFLLAAAGMRWALGAFGWARRHTVLIMRIGGAMLVLIGLLLVLGVWGDVTIWLRSWSAGFEVAV